MAVKEISLSDVNKKRLKLLAYLVSSGLLSWLLQEFVVNNPSLNLILGPAINFLLYSIIEELKNEGYVKAIKG